MFLKEGLYVEIQKSEFVLYYYGCSIEYDWDGEKGDFGLGEDGFGLLFMRYQNEVLKIC